MNKRMSPILSEDVLALLESAVDDQKCNRTYWCWSDKPIKELGVARELIEAQREKEGLCWIRPRSLKPNPESNAAPDCIGADLQNRRIAFEITELVDQTTLENNIKIERAYEIKEWSEEAVKAKIASQLKQKDGKKLYGGPFAEYVVVIHPDEPLLSYDECAAFLQSHSFGEFFQISKAFLVFAPEPGKVSSPYVRLGTRNSRMDCRRND